MGAVRAAVVDDDSTAEDASTLTRLRGSSDRIAVLADELRTEQGRRNALVVLARDEGASWRKVAAAARCSMSRCVAIVGGT